MGEYVPPGESYPRHRFCTLEIQPVEHPVLAAISIGLAPAAVIAAIVSRRHAAMRACAPGTLFPISDVS